MLGKFGEVTKTLFLLWSLSGRQTEVKLLLELANCFDKSGVDLFFLILGTSMLRVL